MPDALEQSTTGSHSPGRLIDEQRPGLQSPRHVSSGVQMDVR